MSHGRLPGGASLLAFALLLGSLATTVYALEEGEVTGKILRTNDKFLRDYQELDYPGDRVRAKYRMGWDALHALEVKKLDE